MLATPHPTPRLATQWRKDLGDYVVCAAVLGNSELAVFGLGNGTVVAAELGDGRPRFAIPAHTGTVLRISPAPDGAAFVTSGNDTAAKVWSSNGELVRELPGAGTAWVENVAWSPSGELVAAAAGRMVRVWDATGELVGEHGPVASTVADLAWRHDGQSLAAACYGGVHIWSSDDGRPARHLSWKGSLLSVAWSPDGKIIASSSQDRSVHFWRLDSGDDSEMSGYPVKPKALAWDSESKLLATAGDSVATLWDFRGKGPEGTRPIQLRAHSDAITTLAFQPRKGVLASGAKDGSVCLWEPRRRQQPIRTAHLPSEVTTLTWHPRTRALLASDGGGIVCYFEPL